MPPYASTECDSLPALISLKVKEAAPLVLQARVIVGKDQTTLVHPERYVSLSATAQQLAHAAWSTPSIC